MALFFLLAAFLGCVLARPSSENVTPINTEVAKYTWQDGDVWKQKNLNKVEVTLYYETLCPSCRQFIPNQLLPTYTGTRYASLISKLTLVPYGHVLVKNATIHDYECQHGQSECEGNKLHSCAIKYITDEVTTLNYISCLENKALAAFKIGSLKYPIDKCQNKLPAGLYPKIINCYNSDEGWTLFEKNGKKTNSFFTIRNFVPYVSFNDKIDNDLALEAISDFRKTLCKVAGVIDNACSS